MPSTRIVTRSLLALLFLSVAVAPSLRAQMTTGIVEGRLVSTDGQAVSAVAVAITGLSLSATTDGDGRFTLRNVPAGMHSVVVTDRGLEAMQGSVVVEAGATTRITLELDPSAFTLRARAAVGGSGERALPLPGLTVTSGRSASGYVERHADVGVGFPTAIARVPQSVHVIPRRMMEEQQPVTISDVVRNVAGVSGARNSVEPFRAFKLRGFGVGESITDGIRNTGSLNIQAEGMANIERVEILRGPGGAVFGLGSPGGTVNIVTKKPLPDARYAFALRTGSFGYVQPEADLTGPLGSSGLRYRLVATWERRESFIDFVEPEAAQIAPSLEWVNDSGLKVRYQADWRKRELLRYVSHPFVGTVTETDRFSLPRSLFTGEPGQGNTVAEGLMHSAVIEKTDGSSGFQRIYARLNRSDFTQPSVAPASLEPDGRTLSRRFNLFTEDEKETVLGGQLVRVFSAGGAQHTVSFGLDYANWKYNSLFERGSIAPLDVVSPVYGAEPSPTFVLSHSVDRFRQVGGYVQDVVNPVDALTVLVGVRWDRLSNETESLDPPSTGERTDGQLSPRLGLSWEVAPGVVPFGSWAKTFTAGPNFGFVRTPDGAPLGPERGRQVEAGLKVDIGSDLMATFSVYDLEKSNVPTADPDDPAFRVPTGRQRARGAEFMTAWEPLSSLSLFGSYAYTDAEVTEDTNIPVGTPLDNAPKHTARVWASTSWELGNDWTGGLKFGAHMSSDVFPAIGAEQVVPGFTIGEGGAFLRRGALMADLMIHNITDRYYFLRGAFGGTGVIPGDARRLVVTLGWRP